MANEDTAKGAGKSAGRPLGVSGETVRANIKRVRGDKGMSQNDLSAKLREVGRPIPTLGIHRIENGDRRVDVDDLVAIAVALGVSPTTFLVPDSLDGSDPVTATGLSKTYPATALWDWMRMDHFIDRASTGMEQFEFIKRAAPTWRAAQYAEGVLQLIELKRIEDGMKSDDPDVAEEARRRFEQVREEYADGDD